MRLYPLLSLSPVIFSVLECYCLRTCAFKVCTVVSMCVCVCVCVCVCICLSVCLYVSKCEKRYIHILHINSNVALAIIPEQIIHTHTRTWTHEHCFTSTFPRNQSNSTSLITQHIAQPSPCCPCVRPVVPGARHTTLGFL